MPSGRVAWPPRGPGGGRQPPALAMGRGALWGESPSRSEAEEEEEEESSKEFSEESTPASYESEEDSPANSGAWRERAARKKRRKNRDSRKPLILGFDNRPEQRSARAGGLIILTWNLNRGKNAAGEDTSAEALKWLGNTGGLAFDVLCLQLAPYEVAQQIAAGRGLRCAFHTTEGEGRDRVGMAVISGLRQDVVAVQVPEGRLAQAARIEIHEGHVEPEAGQLFHTVSREQSLPAAAGGCACGSLDWTDEKGKRSRRSRRNATPTCPTWAGGGRRSC